MAITNYSTLQAAISTWLARADLTSVIPDFIAMAESEMNRTLRCRHNEANAVGAIAAGALAVPVGYIEMRACYIETTDPVYLEAKPLLWVYQEYRTDDVGPPRYFARENADFIFYPTATGTETVQMFYYKELDLATDTTNDVITNYRDMYLYGSLQHAAAYTRDVEQESKWASRFYQAVEKANMEEHSAVTADQNQSVAKG